MNILLINHYAGSTKHGMEYRPYYLAKYWVKAGHQVSIIASSEAHVRKNKPQIQGQVTEEDIEGIKYYWIKNIEYQGNGLKRIFNMFFFVLKLFFFHRSFVKAKPDVVIASSTYPLDIFPARYLAKKYNAKLVFELHDLWPLSPMILGGYSKLHPFILFMQFAENYWCRHVDLAISFLSNAKEYLVAHGLTSDKFRYIPNGIEISEWNSTAADSLEPSLESFIRQRKDEGDFIVGYAGSHSFANALDVLLYAAEILVEEKVCIILVGQGQKKNELIAKARELKLTNLFFFDPIAKNQIPSYLGLCDALHISFKKCQLYSHGVSPNKLFDYMMAEKPILYAIDAGNDPVKEANCGISIGAEDPIALSQAILRLKDMTSEDRLRLGQNGKDFLLREHDYRVLAEKMSNYLKDI